MRFFASGQGVPNTRSAVCARSTSRITGSSSTMSTRFFGMSPRETTASSSESLASASFSSTGLQLKLLCPAGRAGAREERLERALQRLLVNLAVEDLLHLAL